MLSNNDMLFKYMTYDTWVLTDLFFCWVQKKLRKPLFRYHYQNFFYLRIYIPNKVNLGEASNLLLLQYTCYFLGTRVFFSTFTLFYEICWKWKTKKKKWWKKSCTINILWMWFFYSFAEFWFYYLKTKVTRTDERRCKKD